MFEAELAGEDSSENLNDSGHSTKPKRGRPPGIQVEELKRAVVDLHFLLEQNWGVVGWMLSQAKSNSDVRNALRSIQNERCGRVEPFKEDRTRPGTQAESRACRTNLLKAEQEFRINAARLQRLREKCEQALHASVTESNSLKKAQVQASRKSLSLDFVEAEALEQISRSVWESRHAELREREAHFAQSEILRFLLSNRRRFTPANIARAMAGLPHVTARVSCELCTRHGINPPDGIVYNEFRTIQRFFRKPISGGVMHRLDLIRTHLINGPEKSLPHIVELRKNWYFLEESIRSEACVSNTPQASLCFRIFARYRSAIQFRSPTDELLAETHRLKCLKVIRPSETLSHPVSIDPTLLLKE